MLRISEAKQVNRGRKKPKATSVSGYGNNPVPLSVLSMEGTNQMSVPVFYCAPWLLASDLEERDHGGFEMLRRCDKFKHWIESNGFIDLESREFTLTLFDFKLHGIHMQGLIRNCRKIGIPIMFVLYSLLIGLNKCNIERVGNLFRSNGRFGLATYDESIKCHLSHEAWGHLVTGLEELWARVFWFKYGRGRVLLNPQNKP
ncbi:hypothetical protein Cgig2_006328 [Carnegiea gigantea]|uniref:Uncharacterized protein n=1 Tax=Carnegiea gigantea TaxID=171969 RepID=A0A9Q1Q7R8_9CARY|nr:hypothetical protein Cgig2_006328 [Carnegiea gigantea]